MRNSYIIKQWILKKLTLFQKAFELEIMLRNTLQNITMILSFLKRERERF
jgi:hypothetical protein